ncbi:TonB-dependent receptor plug domain-containing protein [Hydrogenophaga crassostreae]|uniref:TonB-dependent receptor plug domain-containing protein n=1 Tax=Hydrogenophaga crassostreae TaxID=1763535 RepID=UPI0009ED37E6|nr:TonB-dependent receptor [Hydrogenophaga crassostreae]
MHPSVHPSKKPGPARVAAGLLLCAGLSAAFPAAAATDVITLSLEELLNLTVVGASKYAQKQNEVAAAVSVVTRDEIRAFGWRTLDQALATLPGVYTTYDRQSSHLGTRGFSVPGDLNTRLLVTINGNRVNDLVFDTGPTGRDFPLDLALVERIEFIPGPGSAVYGQNAMFGVVNVVTRNGAAMDEGELALGSQPSQGMNEGRVSWGKRLDSGLDVLISASGLRSRGEDRDMEFGSTGISGRAQGLDGERDKEFFGRLGYGPWTLELVHGDRRKDDPTGVYGSDPLVAGQYQGNLYTLAQAQFESPFSDETLQVMGRVFVGQNRYSSRLSYGTPFDFPSVGDWYGGELRLLSTALDGHKLMLGMDLQDITRLNQAVIDPADSANNLLIRSPARRVGIYGQDEWHLADDLTATLGLRMDRNSTTGTHISPRAALIWQAAPSTTLKALAGRAHRAPNANERDYYDDLVLVANPSLDVESVDTLELVANHRVSEDLRLQAAAYRWTMLDQIVPGVDPVSGLSQFQPGGKVVANGLELSADKTWVWGGRLRGSLTLQDARMATGDRLANSPQQLAKFNFSMPWRAAGVSLGYEFQYDSRRKTLDGSWLGGRSLSNLHIRTDRWVDGLELGLTVRNLFNKRFAVPGGTSNWQNALEQDGRSVQFEASYRF